MDLISSIQGSMEIAKKLRDVSKRIQDSEFLMLVADLTDALADAKLSAAELKTKLAEQMNLNQELEAQLNAKDMAQPVFKNHVYLFGDDPDAYCPGCWDSSSKKIRLRESPPAFDDFGKWECPVCDSNFG